MNIKDFVRLGTRVLNIIFWMILAYLAGDVGMGFYYISFILIELLIVLFGSGLKHAVARMVAIRRSKGLHYNSRLVFRYGILYSLVVGLLLGFVIWSFSGDIFRKLVGYTLPESVFGVMGVFFIIHMLRDCLQGYYQGKGNTLICIIAEIAQGILMVALCPFLVVRMYKYGMNISGLLKNELYANIGGAIGAVMAQCIAGVICILILVIGDRVAGTVDRNQYNSVKGVDNGRNILLQFFKTSLLFVAEHILPVLTIAYILILYVRRASAGGVDTREVFSDVGVFSGKYLIVIGFFMAIFIEFVDRECKKIRQDAAREEHKNVRSRASYLLKNTMILLLPVTFTVILMPKALCGIFFAGRIAEGAKILRLGGIALLLGGICYMCKAVFASIDLKRYSILGGLVGFVGTVIPAGAMIGAEGGIESLAVAFVIGLLIESAVMLVIFYRMLSFDLIDIGIRIGKIFVAGLVFAGMIAILDHFIVMNIIFLVITLVIAYAAYTVTLLVLKGVGIRDINSLKGSLVYYPLLFAGNIFLNR